MRGDSCPICGVELVVFKRGCADCGYQYPRVRFKRCPQCGSKKWGGMDHRKKDPLTVPKSRFWKMDELYHDLVEERHEMAPEEFALAQLDVRVNPTYPSRHPV
jgi:hypothetical protein